MSEGGNEVRDANNTSTTVQRWALSWGGAELLRCCAAAAAAANAAAAAAGALLFPLRPHLPSPQVGS